MNAFDIFSLLSNNSQTLSIAESCTGGGLAYELSLVPGISQVFLGSITAYSNLVKENILHVPHEIIAAYGAVSEEVAISMAQNCQKLFSSTWALSTTGIAGPTGATANKPVGLVWIGLCGPKGAFAKKFIFSNLSRSEHQRKTISEGLNMLGAAL